MLDDMLDYLERIRDRPVWQPIPEAVRARFREPLPSGEGDLAVLHQRFLDDVLPFAVGNAHPGFMGWVHGGGTPAGMLAEMLAAGLNANLGGRDQIPVEVERQIVAWMRELFNFPQSASGLFVTGSSMANLIALLVARTARLGAVGRVDGMVESRLVAYTSAAAHICVTQAMEIAGLGRAALRVVPVDDRFRIDIAALGEAVAADRRAGREPFFLAATAGTVDTGAIDDLSQVAEVARRERLWFHVDGALGALAKLAPELEPLLRGIERADSIAFDFHKWGQVPYDAGFILVRDGERHRETFAAPASYLRRETRGLAAGSPWPCDLGPDLSRGFRALKTWFTIKLYGRDRLGTMIARSCAIARHLGARIASTPALELLAPVSLNIVCFRYRSAMPDALNQRIVVELQEAGMVAPSSTTVNGAFAIRAAIVNHRTTETDVETLVQETLRLGEALANHG
jgi:aromatic-L-amino-acid/L-tryptophan decarboxylase